MATNETQPIAEAGIDQSEEEEQIDIEMPRLPDIVLRQIFGYLDYSDIKSCRLVSSQWHRFALDSFNFVLSIQRLPQPAGNSDSERPVSVFLDADDVNRHVNRLALFPYAKTLGQSGAKQILNRVGDETMNHNSEPFYFHQLPHVINETFARKIKHVILQDFKPIILPVLDTLAQMLPAAEHVKAIDFDGNDNESVLWAADFDKQKQTGDFRCSHLDLHATDADHPQNSIATRLLSKDADFIVKLIANNWWSVQQMLADIESNNSNQPLVFGKCEQLFAAKPSPHPTDASFRSIAAHFPNLQTLRCAIGGPNDSVTGIEALEQLTSLTALNIQNNDRTQQQHLPQLCLPGLAELVLGFEVQLPANPGRSNWSGLKRLSLDARADNVEHLMAYVRQHGRSCLSNLTVLTAVNLPRQEELITGFATAMLAAANNLRTLETVQFVPVECTPIISTIYAAVTAFAPGLEEFTIGTFCLDDDDEVDCRGLVQQLVNDIKQRSLKAAITVDFCDNDHHAMINAMAEAGVGGDDVTVSLQHEEGHFRYVYDLTWNNNAAGHQQQLKIEVIIQLDE